MHGNFVHMATDIAVFMAANLLFMFALSHYRKTGGRILARMPSAVKRHLLQDSFIKLCFIFAAAYFAASVSYSHMGIGCEDLDEAAQCECYALEVTNRKDMKQKIHWARNGLRMCPDSKFFSNFLDTHQGAIPGNSF